MLRLRDQIADVPPGTVVHVIATDPAAPLDLPAWCHMTGHTYLGPAPANGRCTPGSAPPTPSSRARTLPGTRSGAGDASRRPSRSGHIAYAERHGVRKPRKVTGLRVLKPSRSYRVIAPVFVSAT
ncbi:sulfurtransferase TusA family protein [Streptomyces sp. UP1A-1]|nr:sulfurtransferase TusA family protein [Streptomyces sp. UP1A-1]